MRATMGCIRIESPASLAPRWAQCLARCPKAWCNRATQELVILTPSLGHLHRPKDAQCFRSKRSLPLPLPSIPSHARDLLAPPVI